MRHTLEETLNELRDQLDHIDDLDPQQVEQLRNAVAEIHETLDTHEVSSEGLAHRLREATQEFSGSHPYLTNTIGRVADLLSQLGI